MKIRRLTPEEAGFKQLQDKENIINSSLEQPLTLILEGDKERFSVLLSASLANAIVEMIEQLGKGNTVTVISNGGEISTQEAADLLQVSRPYIIKLLEEGKIPYRKVGCYRRLKAADVLKYKENIDRLRMIALDELTSQAQELGMGY